MSDTKNISKTIAQIWDLRTLSKDLAAALTDKAVKQKEVVLDVLANEFSNFLSKINIAEEAQKVMDGMTLNLEASVNFKDKKIQPKSIKMSSAVKSSKKSKKRKATSKK